MSPFAFRIMLCRFVVQIFPVVEKVFRRLEDFTDAAFEFAHRRNGFLVWCVCRHLLNQLLSSACSKSASRSPESSMPNEMRTSPSPMPASSRSFALQAE